MQALRRRDVWERIFRSNRGVAHLEGGGDWRLRWEDQGACHTICQLREGHDVQQALQYAQGTQWEQACRNDKLYGI